MGGQRWYTHGFALCFQHIIADGAKPWISYLVDFGVWGKLISDVLGAGNKGRLRAIL